MTSTHYVSNERLLKELKTYQQALRKAKRHDTDPPAIPDYIGECFIKIAERLSRKKNFYSYTFREEMIGDAIENCIQYMNNFNPKKSTNPFAYFTQIIYYAFLRRILREKKHLYVKYKMAEYYTLQQSGLDAEDEDQLSPAKLYDNLQEYIREFETKHNIKPRIKGLEKFMTE